MISDAELNRAVNALSTTLRDQRPAELDAERCQQIVDGALGGERKLLVRVHGAAGELVTADAAKRVGSISSADGGWKVTRDVDASASGWAQP